MASGKKQYLISNSSYGIPMTLRAARFDNYDPGSEGTEFDSSTQQSSMDALFDSLSRTDRVTTSYPTSVDPVRVLAARTWGVHGTGTTKTLKFLSGSMKEDASNLAFDAMPFDVVYSDETPKTGDGVIPDSLEDMMTSWRDSALTTSGLFSVYQENFKLIPVENTYFQYYLAITGLTAEEIQAADEGESSSTYGDDAKVGAVYQQQGAMYIWNRMRRHLLTKMDQTSAYGVEDYSTYVDVPFSPAEAEMMAFDGAMMNASVNPEYNFYATLYEQYLAPVPELALPCLMLQSAAEAMNGDPMTSTFSKHNLSLGGALAQSAVIGLNGGNKTKSNDSAQAMALSSVYWNSYGKVLGQTVKAYKSTQSSTSRDVSDDLFSSGRGNEILYQILQMNPKLARAADGCKNLVFSGDYSSLISDFALKRENYPMHVEINFTTDYITQFSDYLNDAGLMPLLLDALIASHDEPGFSGPNLIREIANSKKPVTGDLNAIFEAEPKITIKQRDDGGVSVEQRSSVQPKKRIVLDVETWLQSCLNNGQDTSKMLGRLHAHVAKRMTNSLEMQINSIIALGKIKDLVTDNVRSYSQILDGDSAYSETVAYRVAKYDESGNFIQNFWFANSSEISVIDFVDTQVKYSNTYIYRIFAYNFIIGTRYNIRNQALDMSATYKSLNAINSAFRSGDTELKTMDWDDATLSKQCWFTPCLKIAQTLIYSQRAMVFDSAPIVPEFEIYPYKGISDKVLLLFKGSVGRQELMPLSITYAAQKYGPTFSQTESDVLTLQALYQDITPGSPLLYESDDRPETFEVFRTNIAPYSYDDFSEKLYAEVSTLIPGESTTYPISEISPKYADSATLIDTIVPNTKYYYMVRQVDVHGNVSNPTAIFEVEMIVDNGVTLPVIKEYEFIDPVPRAKRKYFNKYIKIAPTPAQVLINTEDMTSAFDAAEGTVQLGMSDINLWSKQFKIRITSDTTGKAADLNITFNQKHNKTLTEEDMFPTTDEETNVSITSTTAIATAMESRGHKGSGTKVRSTSYKQSK